MVVVQTNGLLRVWYNLETPDITVDHEVSGHAVAVYKKSEREPTVVTFEDGSANFELQLDEGRIQFATALESGNLFKAVWHLEQYKMTPEVLSMWQRLARVALENYELRIAQKAYSVLGDVPRYPDESQTNALHYSPFLFYKNVYFLFQGKVSFQYH